MIDLSTIAAGTNSVQIRHPGTAEPIGLTFHLLPSSAEPVKQVQRRLTNESLRTRGKGMTAEKLEASRLDVLTAAVSAWDWADDCSWNGEKLECTPANVRRVLRDAAWLRDQVDEAFGDEAGFFKS